MILTVEDISAMNGRGTLEHKSRKDSRGLPVKIRLSGQIRIKKDGTFEQPVKHGLYNNFLLTQKELPEWIKKS